MAGFDETQITRAILDAYHRKLSDSIVSDVVIVGAGPSGLTAAYHLARRDLRVTLVEKRLSPGGGIWGGGMAMNEVALQTEALPILDELGIRHRPVQETLHTADAMELACGLCLKALQAGVTILNLTAVEDICIHDDRVTGVVVNRTTVYESLPVDPLMLQSRAVLDATGHEASVLQTLQRRGLFRGSAGGALAGEGPMNANAGERFVVEKAGEVYPGLWVSGMGVCAAYGGPRMGPIFGGMLLSGQRVAELITAALRKST